MKAEIIAVGTELLIGQISNTNAMHISRMLHSIGVGVYHHSVVGDNKDRLKETFKIAFDRSDIIILTGGLGPTDDDMTKECIAEYLGEQLIFHQESYKYIEDFFNKMNKPLCKNNMKQAYMPKTSKVLRNLNGTAPGVLIEKNNKLIFLLPGPPREMIPMMENHVIPNLLEKTKQTILSVFIKVFGLGESYIEDKIFHLIKNQINPTLATYASLGETSIRVTASSKTNENLEEIIKPIKDELINILGDNIYSFENSTLEEVVCKGLLEKNLKISTAESCTGGMLSGRIANVSGVSQILKESIVTYSNEAKIKYLGVKDQTLRKYGAVSSETAIEMANGLKRNTSSDICISITGIAGPGGGTDEKPVGLVYIGLSGKDNHMEFKKLMLHGNRESIRIMSCLHALDMIRRYMNSI